MATIRSQLQLTDGMTHVLTKINRALNTCLDSFESVQRASGQAVNTANIEQARSELVGANQAVEEMAKNLNDAGNKQNSFNRNVSTGNGLVSKLVSTVGRLVAAYAGIQGISKLTELSDTLTSTKARLELIVDDGGSVDELQRKIYQSAQNARASYTDTMATVAKLGLVAGDAFQGNDELIKFQELVNKNFVVGGASATEASSAMYQLTQALGSGRLQGDEYRSIIENAPLLAKSIEDYMRNVQKVEGTMKDWASEGLLTADVIKAAVFRSADEVEGRFANMPKTWAQVWTDMKNRAVVALDPILKKINALANNQKVQAFLSGMLNGLTAIASIALEVFDVICDIANFFQDNWSLIGPIIYGIVGALLLYKAVTLIIMAIEGIRAAVTGVLAAAQMLQTGATFAATAAQHGLNAALWACPITWIIALIVVLIVLFVMFTEQIVGAVWWLGALFKNVGLWIANCGIAAWEVIKNVGLWFANLGLSIWAVIKNIGLWFANLGMSIWAVIKNVGLFFANLGLGIWEVMKACASNVATAFKNGWLDIQIGFWGMVNVLMQGIKKLAELANKCLGWMGVNIDTSGLDFAAKKIDEINAKREDYKSIGDAWDEGFNTFQYENVGDAMSTFDYDSVADAWNTNNIDWSKVGEGFNTFDTFQDGWGSDAYNAGAEKGAAIKDWMSDNLSVGGIMNKLGLNGSDAEDYGMDLNSIAGDTGDIADSSAATAGALSSSTEDLKYLRDLAEQEAINRFTTAEVKLDFTGMTNKISSDMDLDGVISKLTEGFSESLELAAEGVHS